MIDAPPSSSAASEARLELAVAASATERANKPRWIIVLGILALIVATIYTFVALQSRAGILSQMAAQRAYTKKVKDLKQKLEDESAKLTARGTAPSYRVNADLENLARGMEITLAGAIVDSQDTSQAGMKRHTFTAHANNQDPERILRWLLETQKNSNFAGLEIMRLVLRPGGATAENTPGWNVDVQFGRWEKNP